MWYAYLMGNDNSLSCNKIMFNIVYQFIRARLKLVTVVSINITFILIWN